MIVKGVRLFVYLTIYLIESPYILIHLRMNWGLGISYLGCNKPNNDFHISNKLCDEGLFGPSLYAFALRTPFPRTHTQLPR